MRRVLQIRQNTPSAPDLVLQLTSPVPPTNPATALDFGDYSSDTYIFGFQGPIHIMNALPVNLDWHSGINDTNMFLKVDQELKARNDT